jgi:hypothetical protein
MGLSDVSVALVGNRGRDLRAGGSVGALALLVAGLAMIALSLPAHAGFGPANLDNDYEGRAERDPFTYVGFDVGNGKVAKVTAHLHYACTDGEQGRARARMNGKLTLHGNRFAGTLRAVRDFGASRGGDSPGRIKYRVRGKLKRGGKAKGEIDAEIRFRAPEMRGAGEMVRCYSGRLAWKARRGADLDVELPI